jgi:hypothetical protein
MRTWQYVYGQTVLVTGRLLTVRWKKRHLFQEKGLPMPERGPHSFEHVVNGFPPHPSAFRPRSGLLPHSAPPTLWSPATLRAAASAPILRRRTVRQRPSPILVTPPRLDNGCRRPPPKAFWSFRRNARSPEPRAGETWTPYPRTMALAQSLKPLTLNSSNPLTPKPFRALKTFEF